MNYRADISSFGLITCANVPQPLANSDQDAIPSSIKASAAVGIGAILPVRK